MYLTSVLNSSNFMEMLWMFRNLYFEGMSRLILKHLVMIQSILIQIMNAN